MAQSIRMHMSTHRTVSTGREGPYAHQPVHRPPQSLASKLLVLVYKQANMSLWACIFSTLLIKVSTEKEAYLCWVWPSKETIHQSMMTRMASARTLGRFGSNFAFKIMKPALLSCQRHYFLVNGTSFFSRRTYIYECAARQYEADISRRQIKLAKKKEDETKLIEEKCPKSLTAT